MIQTCSIGFMSGGPLYRAIHYKDYFVLFCFRFAVSELFIQYVVENHLPCKRVYFVSFFFFFNSIIICEYRKEFSQNPECFFFWIFLRQYIFFSLLKRKKMLFCFCFFGRFLGVDSVGIVCLFFCFCFMAYQLL